MPKTASHTTRFRKTLKQFLDLKQSGKLNGKAAVVEEKLKTAAEIAGLDFDKELAGISRKNPAIKVRQLDGTDSGNELPGNRADRHWVGDKIQVGFDVKPWHIDPDKAAEYFTLKGIEFGNWLNAEDRTEYLANTMQGLYIMSRIIGVEPEKMGINGHLGIAFGARGMGGAIAHYEPVNNVMINLTKEMGQHSLAHEYAHAVDNLAGYDIGKPFVSGGRTNSKEKDLLKGSDPLTETLNKFYNTLFYTNGKKSAYFNRMVGKTEYEQRRLEILARCSEIYFDLECKERGLSSDYISKASFGGINPDEKEFEAVRPILKTFFRQAFELFEGKEPAREKAEVPEKPEKETPKSEEKEEKEIETPKPSASTGKKVSVDFKADGSEKHQGTWHLIEAKTLTASHNKDCSANSKHRISRGQPRDRSLDNLCAQPKFIAKTLNPESISRGNLAFQGAPVTTPDGMVIQGNGRSIALKIAWDEIPSSSAKYKEFLEENAAEFGFTKKQVNEMKQPVLVRVLDVDDKEAIRLGNITDTSQAKMSRIDQAKALIRGLNRTKLEAIGRIIGNSSGETIGAIIEDIGIRIFDQVRDLDRTGLIEKNDLTADGKEFLRSVLTGLVFDSDKNKNALRDFLDNSRTLQAGIERSFGYIIPLIGQGGDIRSALQEAIQITAEIKRNDAFNSVNDVMTSQDMFSGGKTYGKQSQDLATFLLESTTQKAIRDGFRSYRDHINGREDLFNPIKAQPQAKAFEAAFIKRENPPEHLVKLYQAGEFDKGDIIRDYYDNQKYRITSKRKNKVYTRELDSGKRQVFNSAAKRFVPNREVAPTLPLFGDEEPRKNFTIRLYPIEKNRQTSRFLKEATEVERAVVRGMVAGQNYDKYLEKLSEPKKSKFYQNLAFRLGLFRDDGQSLWISYVHRPIIDFARAIEDEAKKLFSDEPRQNQNRTDIRTAKYDNIVWIVEKIYKDKISLVHPFDSSRGATVPKELVQIHSKKESERQIDGINYFKKRKNPNRTDIRLIKPKYQFKTEKEAWASVTGATGLKKDQVTADHSAKSWRWKRVARPNPAEKETIKDFAAKYQVVMNKIASGGDDLSTNELTALNREKMDILSDFEKKVDYRRYGASDPFDLLQPHIRRVNPGKEKGSAGKNITLVMLGVAEEVTIDQGTTKPVTLLGPHAMLTNKKKNTVFVVPFSKLKKLPEKFRDAKANEVYEMWHNFEPGGPDFSMPWPQEKPKPVGWAHSILYASDKILREWDAKGKLNLYEHDFDPGKRPAFKKGGILMITNLAIDERGI